MSQPRATCPHVTCPWEWKAVIAKQLQTFVGDTPTFLGYYCAYDWVVLCQLYGPMLALPKTWPMYCRDLRQWLDDHGHTQVTQPDDMPHHALSDAQWIMEAWKKYAV